MTSYMEYRKHMQELAFEKQKLNRIISEKLKAHKEYLAAHKIYMQKTKEQDAQTKKLMEMIPNEY